MSYLFGDILLLSERELVWALGLSAVIVGLTANYFRQIEAVCFDPEFARVRGVPVDRITLLILLLTALTATLLSMLVGIVLAVALISLPTAIARPFSRNLRSEMLLAGAAAAVVTTGGIALSYPFDLPTGPTIVMTGAVGYFAVAMIKR
ncbi:MAG: metal ABC transporter permease, partial [Opitutales bacterium]